MDTVTLKPNTDLEEVYNLILQIILPLSICICIRLYHFRYIFPPIMPRILHNNLTKEAEKYHYSDFRVVETRKRHSSILG